MTPAQAEESLRIAKKALDAVIDIAEMVKRRAPKDSNVQQMAARLELDLAVCRLSFSRVQKYLKEDGWGERKEAQ